MCIVLLKNADECSLKTVRMLQHSPTDIQMQQYVRGQILICDIYKCVNCIRKQTIRNIIHGKINVYKAAVKS